MRHLTLRALVFAFSGDAFRGPVPAWASACNLEEGNSRADWCARGEVEALLEAWELPGARVPRLPTCAECATLLDVALTERPRVLAEVRARMWARMHSAGINVGALV